MASRRDSKAPSKHPIAKIAVTAAPRGRASVAPKRPSKRPIPRSEAPLPSADEEVGRLLAHIATLEKQNAALRGGPTKEALSTLRDGLDAMRETLLAAAAELDAFTRREFDIFDPKVKTLLEVRAVLLKAAGQGARLPPPIPMPSPKARPIVDISELADTVESLRPAAPQGPPDMFVISPLPLPPLPKR